jgi:hypothetical protein
VAGFVRGAACSCDSGIAEGAYKLVDMRSKDSTQRELSSWPCAHLSSRRSKEQRIGWNAGRAGFKCRSLHPARLARCCDLTLLRHSATLAVKVQL